MIVLPPAPHLAAATRTVVAGEAAMWRAQREEMAARYAASTYSYSSPPPMPLPIAYTSTNYPGRLARAGLHRGWWRSATTVSPYTTPDILVGGITHLTTSATHSRLFLNGYTPSPRAPAAPPFASPDATTGSSGIGALHAPRAAAYSTSFAQPPTRELLGAAAAPLADAADAQVSCTDPPTPNCNSPGLNPPARQHRSQPRNVWRGCCDIEQKDTIDTHPSHSCFMSRLPCTCTRSIFQGLLDESFAVVCAPKSDPNFGIFPPDRPAGPTNRAEMHREASVPPASPTCIPIYADADKGHVQMRDAGLEIVDLC
ncbi:hypothetical protein FB451DRAFT_1416798 [Mycena latifolia]|nr:hypothetical protein FB451DRAFT_1416798 [Mycena latifolia]